MEQKEWTGVFPAITTPFLVDLSVDYETFGKQARWLIDSGCNGIVALGSLGESPTLTREEKLEILKRAVSTLGENAPVIAGIAALSTADAVWLAKEAHSVGVSGLMILPPQIYRSDWRETQAHLSAVMQATPLSCMLYNNPVAYGTDIIPDQIVELRAKHPNFHSVKESSGDLRRITMLKHVAGNSLEIFVGMDDVVVESVAAGATGWIAGLVNALPLESVRLFNLAKRAPSAELESLYRWFLPLLRLDTVPKFVQLVKLVQQECGGPIARVRPPRLDLVGAELEDVINLTRTSLAKRPSLTGVKK